MKFFDFGAFQKIRKILSREKYIFHMLFGASHGTPPYLSWFNSNEADAMTMIDCKSRKACTVKTAKNTSDDFILTVASSFFRVKVASF